MVTIYKERWIKEEVKNKTRYGLLLQGYGWVPPTPCAMSRWNCPRTCTILANAHVPRHLSHVPLRGLTSLGQQGSCLKYCLLFFWCKGAFVKFSVFLFLDYTLLSFLGSKILSRLATFKLSFLHINSYHVILYSNGYKGWSFIHDPPNSGSQSGQTLVMWPVWLQRVALPVLAAPKHGIISRSFATGPETVSTHYPS